VEILDELTVLELTSKVDFSSAASAAVVTCEIFCGASKLAVSILGAIILGAIA